MKVIQILLALLISNSAMLIANEPQFINKLKSDAMAGNAKAQCNLGVSYMEVARSPRDYAEAVKWFRKSAEQGNPRAQFNLGVSYFQGLGVSVDKKKAFEWYLKSAEGGIDRAQLQVADCYQKGEGAIKDEKQAAYWFSKAAEKQKEEKWKVLGIQEQPYSEDLLKKAEKGDATAALLVGLNLMRGTGDTAGDFKKAAEWFQKSADQGNANAQYFLGSYYLAGLGVDKNLEKARYWSEKSAQQGNAAGQLALGSLYLGGIGGKKDEKEGFKWIEASARQGYQPAQNIIELGKKP